MIKPKLRFPEFSDSWENYKIEDIFDRVGEPVILDDISRNWNSFTWKRDFL